MGFGESERRAIGELVRGRSRTTDRCRSHFEAPASPIVQGRMCEYRDTDKQKVCRVPRKKKTAGTCTTRQREDVKERTDRCCAWVFAAVGVLCR